MDDKELQLEVKRFFNTATEYRAKSLYMIDEVDAILNANETGSMTNLVKRAYSSLPDNNNNARSRPTGNSMLPESIASRYGASLARFRAATAKYYVRAASAAQGNPNEYFIHNVAGDTEMADNLDEAVSDIRRADNTYEKFRDLAGDIYKDNSGILVFDRYGIFDNDFTLITKVIKGRQILYDPQSSPHDIQTSRFIAFDGMTHSEDTLKRMLQRNNKDVVKEGVNKILKRSFTKNKDNDSQQTDFGSMYLYDREEKKVHFVEFDTEDFIIIRHDVRDPVSVGTRDIKFRVIGGVGQKDEGHYSQSELHTTIPFLNAKTQSFIDFLTAQNRAKDNTQLVAPQAFQAMLDGVLAGQPVIQIKGASPAQPLANQVSAVPQIDLSAMQQAYAQIDAVTERTFPAASQELAGAVRSNLKSIYEGNLQHIKRLLDNDSPIRMAERDYIQVVISAIAENKSHEFLVRSTGISGYGVKKMLGSRLLRMGNEKHSTAVDIREKRVGEAGLILKKEFVAGISAFAQTAFNPANLADYVARNGDKEILRLTSDDLYVLKSPYPAHTVRRVISDIKNISFGEQIDYPFPVTPQYLNTLKECVEMKKTDYTNPDGSMTLEGERVLAFLEVITARAEIDQLENSGAYQEQAVQSVEQEAQARRRSATQPSEDAMSALFANQQTTGVGGE